MQSYSYAGSLKKKLSDAMGKLSHLNIEQKRKRLEPFRKGSEYLIREDACYPDFGILFEFLLTHYCGQQWERAGRSVSTTDMDRACQLFA